MNRYSEQDVHEILKRAVAIEGQGDLDRQVLERSAAELGISLESLRKAEEQYLVQGKEQRLHEEFQRERRRGFVAHLIPYVLVNLMLFGIFLGSGSSTPWFLGPLMGWGIGIFFHFMASRATEGEDYDKEFYVWRRKRAAPPEF